MMLRKTYQLMKQTRALMGADHQGPVGFKVVPADLWSGDPSRGHDVLNFFGAMNDDTVAAMVSRPGLQTIDLTFHRFDWLADLKALGSHEARACAVRMVSAWLDQNVVADPVTGSIDLAVPRMMRILGHISFMAPAAPESFIHRLAMWCQHQARIWRRLQPDHPLAGLGAAVGQYTIELSLGGGQFYEARVAERLDQALRSAVLVDGGPVTRRPSDLPPLLQILLDLRHLCETAAHPVPVSLAHAIDRVVPALQFFQMGDGGVAAFHGGHTGDRNFIRRLLQTARMQVAVPVTLPYTGYERLAMADMVVLMDAGVARDADHASTTAFECSIGSERVIVGCGQHATDPMWRDLLAATSAHSTLTLDHRDNRDSAVTPEVEIARADLPTGPWVQVRHTGYIPAHGFIHTRSLRLDETGGGLMGEDRCETTMPPLQPLPCMVRFHIHPRVQVRLEQGQVIMTLRDGQSWIFKCDSASISLEESVYLAATGKPEKTKQIVLTRYLSGPLMTLMWSLVPA